MGIGFYGSYYIMDKRYYVWAKFLFTIIKLSVIFEIKSDFYNVLKV